LYRKAELAFGRAVKKTEVQFHLGSVLMPGLTSCPFCQSPRIRSRLPERDLQEYECEACTRTWLVARPKRQARIVAFPTAAARSKRRAGGRKT
jgi:transposase-like protein